MERAECQSGKCLDARAVPGKKNATRGFRITDAGLQMPDGNISPAHLDATAIMDLQRDTTRRFSD